MNNCLYHPVYRVCRNCGKVMERSEQRVCQEPASVTGDAASRIDALREVRALILSNAKSNWKSGLTERSDALTDLLTEFDRAFPESRE